MTIALAIISIVVLGLFIAMLLKSQRFQKLVGERDAEIAAVKHE